MSDIIIRTSGLSKIYRLGDIGTGTLSHDLNRLWARFRGREDPYLPVAQENVRDASGEDDYIWALQDIDLEIRQGDVVGIIGKNGAGKSTLLKLMSRITSPTQGRIEINGRIGTLLEVGTGMHPEMTALENIYLNGAILGMQREEISRNIDNILEFSGIKKYTHTPIKRFSSGMRVRLGFAVAAFLESEILIVDEVLAVGDLEFQRKAMGKLNEVTSQSGRTILFVSHNLEMIEQICNRCILIENGRLITQGDTEDVINSYTQKMNDFRAGTFDYSADRPGLGQLRITGVRIKNLEGEETDRCETGGRLRFELEYSCKLPMKRVRVVIIVHDAVNTMLFRLDTSVTIGDTIDLENTGWLHCETGEINLKPGRYFLNVNVYSHGELQDRLGRPGYFDIITSDYFGTGLYFRENRPMKMLVRHQWDIC